MKKILLLVIVLSVGGAVYFFLGGKKSPETMEEEMDIDAPTSLGIPAIKETMDDQPVSLGKSKLKPLPRKDVPQGEEAERKLDDMEMGKLETYFEKIENQWEEQMQELILGEMNLSKNEFNKYKNYRASYEKEKMEAFQEFHEFMRKKHGENYTYSPSEDQEAFDQKIQDEYEGYLKDLFGKGNYKTYKSTKKKFNNDMQQSADETVGVYFMEI